jgi:hypothetical protein
MRRHNGVADKVVDLRQRGRKRVAHERHLHARGPVLKQVQARAQRVAIQVHEHVHVVVDDALHCLHGAPARE